MSWRIRTVSERTGVNVETLRSWERRYSLVQPVRSSGGYRLYSEDDIAVIERVKTLVEAGLAVSEAIEQARREGLIQARPEPDPPVAAETPATGGALAATRSALIASLLDVDRPRADAVLAAIPPLSFDRLTRELLLPAAREIGALHARGAASVLQERFAHEFVRERLFAMLAALGSGPVGGPEAVCVGGPDEGSELGLLGSAVHLALAGWRVTCLGADFPPGELGPFLEKRGAGLLLVSMVRARPESERRSLLRRLRMMAPPTTQVVAGGAGARGDGSRIEGVGVARSFDDLPTP